MVFDFGKTKQKILTIKYLGTKKGQGLYQYRRKVQNL